MSWRTSSETADISGYNFFQTAYLDTVSNRIVSYSDTGGVKVNKYVKDTSVRYKKMLDEMFFRGIAGDTYLTKNGYNFTEINPTIGDSPYYKGIKKIGNRYFVPGVVTGQYVLYVFYSDDLETWTNTNIHCERNVISGIDNVVISNHGTYQKYKYSTDAGATWSDSPALGIDILSLTYLSSGKVAIYYEENDPMEGTNTHKIKLLDGLTSATGTSYTVFPTDNYSEILITEMVEYQGHLYFIVFDNNSWVSSFRKLNLTTGVVAEIGTQYDMGFWNITTGAGEVIANSDFTYPYNVISTTALPTLPGEIAEIYSIFYDSYNRISVIGTVDNGIEIVTNKYSYEGGHWTRNLVTGYSGFYGWRQISK